MNVNFADIESRFAESANRKCAVAPNGMVAAAFPEATEAGVEILAQGGNAVDAACATAIALGVCEPQASGIGGQGIAMVHINGRTFTLDGSSRTPSRANKDAYNDPEEIRKGYRTVTIPSTVAMLGYLNRHYGRLSWSDILQPAIRIAQNGYRITPFQHKMQLRELDAFMSIPSQSGARYFLKDGREPYQPGDRFIQPELAKTLIYLAEHGPESFYHGLIAQQIDADMRANDGFLRAEDLALIPWPVEREPLQASFRGLTAYSSPPPSAGHTLLTTLMMLAQFPSDFFQEETPQSYQVMVESFRKALLQRQERPYHQSFPPLPDKDIISPAHAQSMAQATQKSLDWPQEDGETTHLSVIDSNGNAVSLTQSVNSVYGSKTAAEGLGFIYNNYMIGFSHSNDPNHPYFLRPNVTPWTSVAPAILFHNSEPWLIIGSPGSARIYTAITQFLIHLLDRGGSMYDAIAHPRLFCQPNGILHVEGDQFSADILDHLTRVGYHIKWRESNNFFFGGVHAVMKCRSKMEFHGVAEVRRDGIAKGI